MDILVNKKIKSGILQKRLISTILFLLTFFNAFSQVVEESSLLDAYCDSEKEKLAEFFSDWEEQSVPISRNTFNTMDRLEKDSYCIFKRFYNPTDLERYGELQWGADLYAKARYIVIQEKLEYIISQENKLTYNSSGDRFIEENKISREGTINDFRPKINTSKKSLYLQNHAFRNALRKLFDNLCVGDSSDSHIAQLLREKIKKIEFVSDFIKVFSPHWRNDIHLISHPYVESIVFNKKITQAIVNFRIGGEGGEALFSKVDDQWKMSKVKITWIE